MVDNKSRNNRGSGLPKTLSRILLGGALVFGSCVGYSLLDQSVKEQQETERIFNYKKTTVEDILENPDYYKENPGIELSLVPIHCEHNRLERPKGNPFDIVDFSGGDPLFPYEILFLYSNKSETRISSYSYSYSENEKYFEDVNNRIGENVKNKSPVILRGLIIPKSIKLNQAPDKVKPNAFTIISQSIKIGSEIYDLSDNRKWDYWKTDVEKYKKELNFK